MKGLRIYLISGAVLLIIYFIAQLNRPKDTNWSETMSNEDKIPFGTYILFNRAHDIFPGSEIKQYRQPIYNVIAEDSVKGSSYIIICQDIDLIKSDYNQLIKYVGNGNDVFIAAEDFGRFLHEKLGIKTGSEITLGHKNMPVNFVSPHLEPKTTYVVDKASSNIFFMNIDTTRAVVLGKAENGNANFLCYHMGKGNLYLACNPRMFSNYSLLKAQGAAYAATALSFVKPTSKILWDIYYTQGDIGNSSPMRVFLNNPMLQWAYYITLLSLIIFVLFEIKRRQRIIPVIEPLNNSTLDFVTTVGQLYYEKLNNSNIAHKKILYLLTYLRDEYQLKTNKLDNEFSKVLAMKLGLQPDFANDLVSYMSYIGVQQHVTDNELIELNKLIEQFYIRSR